MHFRFLLPLGIAIGTVVLHRVVKTKQKEAIGSGIQEVLSKTDDRVKATIRNLDGYERNIMWQYYVSATCLALFCIFALTSDFMTWVVAIVVAFMSMYLFSEVAALWMYSEVVREFRKIFWTRWKKHKLFLSWRFAKITVRRTVGQMIRIRVKEGIKAGVDRKIEDLSLLQKLPYHMLGDDRKAIADNIHKGSVQRIDYEQIIQRIGRTARRVLVTAVIYSTIASWLRFGVIEASGLGAFKWIALPALFIIFFGWHRRRVRHMANQLT